MINPWKKIKEEEFKAGFRKLIKKTFELPNGEVTDFDIKKEGPAVCILAMTPEQNVILTKQFRPGPEKILLEMPGGHVENKEQAESAAARELLEETGFQGKLQFVGESLDCAYSTMIRYNFVATDCVKIKEQQLDATEFIEVVEMPIQEFREYIKTGQTTDVESAYLALDFLKLL